MRFQRTAITKRPRLSYFGPHNGKRKSKKHTSYENTGLLNRNCYAVSITDNGTVIVKLY